MDQLRHHTRVTLSGTASESNRPAPDEVQALYHELRLRQAELEMQNEELRNIQRHLQQTRDRYLDLFHSSPVGYCLLDASLLIVDCNDALPDLLRCARRDLLQRPFVRFVATDQQGPVLNRFRHFEQQLHRQWFELTLRRADDDLLHCNAEIQFKQSNRGRLDEVKYLLTLSDVSELMRKTQELRLKDMAMENTSEGVVITDAENRICYVNKGFERTTGFAYAEVKGKFPSLLKSGRHDDAFYAAMWRDLIREGRWQGEIWNRRKSGQVYPEWLSITRLSSPDNPTLTSHYVAVFSDITAREAMRQQLHTMAYFDGLTGLPNRFLLLDRMRQALAAAQRENRRVGVLFLDIDRFKVINDSQGHAAGDRLLGAFARRLVSCLREADTLARMGGDEFSVLLSGVASKQDSLRVAEKILGMLDQPFELDGREFRVGTSIGISHFPDDADNPETLLKHADIAMYRAKEEGRGTVRLFDHDLNTALQRHFALESELRQAIAEHLLEVHYQPIVDLNTGEIAKLEALSRWHHAEHGMISPAQFVKIAEENGFIDELVRWTLSRVCEHLHLWRGTGAATPRVAVNLSSFQFMQQNLLQMIDSVLNEHCIPAASIELEITESAAMPDVSHSRKILSTLQARDIQISIDDFGSGYSSLSHLRELPIDALKIDMSFIRGLPNNTHDAAIVKSIIGLGSALGLDTVAEGVETREQLRYLKAAECRYGQGYLFSKPVPFHEVADLLHRRFDRD